MERIIVGIDESTAARQALAWAVAEARSRGAVLEAVHAWRAPDMGTDPLERALADPAALAAEAGREARLVVDAADTAGLMVPVQVTVVHGDPIGALLDAARGADLLVVGASGLGGPGAGGPASISGRLERAAPCPVVVVPTIAPVAGPVGPGR
jgi:nucleotide-binding universal stress UspA family protein